jgi:hypothetical protein
VRKLSDVTVFDVSLIRHQGVAVQMSYGGEEYTATTYKELWTDRPILDCPFCLQQVKGPPDHVLMRHDEVAGWIAGHLGRCVEICQGPMRWDVVTGEIEPC